VVRVTVAIPTQPADAPTLPAPAPIATIVDAAGVWPLHSASDDRLAAPAFCWVDVFGGEEAARKALLARLGVEDADLAWAQRFGQAGRMMIARQKLRAVTWVADPAGTLIEVHFLCTPQRILTVWNGNGAVLDEVRQHFAERVGGAAESPPQAAGILLQLLLGTLDHAIRYLDAQLYDQRLQLDGGTGSMDFARLAAQRQELQSAWVSFDRYSSAVRSAIVGVEAIPDMDPRGAAELNDYADQVEDVEEQLQERRRWMSEIVHDYATAIAQRQSEQINRLTLVSLLFLPVTAVTGFFGMNFNWMIGALGSPAAFLVLGLLLPAAMVIITVGWFARRGFIQLRHRPPGGTAPPKPPVSGTGE
jgi:Mg2+ and Co2+ transporter CorA